MITERKEKLSMILNKILSSVNQAERIASLSHCQLAGLEVVHAQIRSLVHLATKEIQ